MDNFARQLFGNEAARTMALDAVPEVARTPGDAEAFAAYLQDLESVRGGTHDAAQGVQRGSGCEAVALLCAAASHTLVRDLAVAR